MFTIEAIKAAHSKVKSGADYPAYVQDLKKMGVQYYETYVTDGNAVYYGDNNFMTQSGSKYTPLNVADISDADKFRACLKAHQQGGSDYPIFCSQAAATGIEKWVADLEKMTCTYYDRSGREILVEQIPG
ncbi:MAG: DUF1398 domain-containing protein [Ferruginibacter sp.]